MSYKPVNDSNLKYQKVDNDFAAEYRKALSSYELDWVAIAESNSDKDAEADFQQTVDLLGEKNEAILKSNFIGFGNYKKHFKDKRMWQALGNMI